MADPVIKEPGMYRTQNSNKAEIIEVRNMVAVGYVLNLDGQRVACSWDIQDGIASGPSWWSITGPYEAEALDA